MSKMVPDKVVSTLRDTKAILINLREEFQDKNVVLFGVPGAFSKNCSSKHFPDFVNNLDKLKKCGVDIVACIAVNDVDVMSAWKGDFGDPEILMLSDPTCIFLKELELVQDEGPLAGLRSKRFAMYISNLNIRFLSVDPGCSFDSSADYVISNIGRK